MLTYESECLRNLEPHTHSTSFDYTLMDHELTIFKRNRCGYLKSTLLTIEMCRIKAGCLHMCGKYLLSHINTCCQCTKNPREFWCSICSVKP